MQVKLRTTEVNIKNGFLPSNNISPRQRRTSSADTIIQYISTFLGQITTFFFSAAYVEERTTMASLWEMTGRLILRNSIPSEMVE